jgi:hypothetical protein
MFKRKVEAILNDYYKNIEDKDNAFINIIKDFKSFSDKSFFCNL